MRILVVDDEVLIAQYIVQCIRDADSTQQIVGTAASGSRALQIMQEESVDLVFADITMPKMDGLELLRAIKSQYPGTSVIMLTCHDEFEYARQAVLDQADNYVLKFELSAQSMGEILRKVQARRERQGVERQTNHMKRNDYLKKVAEDGRELYIITEKDLRRNNIFLLDNAPFIALCFSGGDRDTETVVAAVARDYENLVVYPYTDELTVLMMNLRATDRHWDGEDALNAMLDEYFGAVEERIRGHLGRSRMFFRTAWLGTAIREAVESYLDKFYGGGAVRYAEYGQRTEKLQKMATQTMLRLENQNWSGALDSLRGTVALAREEHPDAEAFRRGLLGACGALRQWDPDRMERCAGRLEQAEDMAQLEGALSELEGVLERLGSRYSDAISRAMDFISLHYTEDLTLNMVADHVFLNREYLSRRFKQEVGMNFSEFLTDLRLQKARELLETTGLRISEVADRIGIPNVSYFSTIFRRRFHCSPSDLRSGGGGKRGTDGGRSQQIEK